MTKEKVISLTKYMNDLNDKLHSTSLPAKQKHRPVEYKQFLSREIAAVSAVLEAVRLEGVKEDSKK